MLDDGHTNALFPMLLTQNFGRGEYAKVGVPVVSATSQMIMQGHGARTGLLQQAISMHRDHVWGSDTYREAGQTAIIRIDGFRPDEAGWEAFYKGEGEMPMDAVGITVSGLRRAAANPAIRNVLFDLSANTGGSSDMLAFILAITTGQNQLYCREYLIGQRMTVTYGCDTNLDGVIDELDREACYDQFRYGVLTTCMAFSCGNLTPFAMQEGGAVLLGEPTGGGSCCVQLCLLSDGMDFIMSSEQWQLTDSKGESVENGCRTDVPIEHEYMTMPSSVMGVEMTLGNYATYFDDLNLDRLMNEWFEEEEALAPAA